MKRLCADIHKRIEDFSLDISFESDATRIGILGASGSGKSMTLRCIAGIEEMDSGHIEIGGRVLYDSADKLNVKPQQRNVGYMFQNYALFPTMSVSDNIMAGLKGSKEERLLYKMMLFDALYKSSDESTDAADDTNINNINEAAGDLLDTENAVYYPYIYSGGSYEEPSDGTIDDSSIETIDDSGTEPVDDSGTEPINDSAIETIEDSSAETSADQP